jgi:hypothetical protein
MFHTKAVRGKANMGKKWQDMDKVEKRIVAVIAAIVLALLSFWFLRPT